MRSFLIGVGSILLFILGFNFGLPLLSPDQPSPPRPQLEPVLTSLAPEKNALTVFSQASQKLALRSIEPRIFLQSGNWIQSEAARLTSSNTEALTLLEQGVALGGALSNARDPQYNTFDAINLEALPRDAQNWHQLCELMLVRAKLNLLSNKTENAWQDMLTVLRAAKLIREAKGTLLELDVGDSLTQLALAQIRASLRQSQLTDTIWKQHLRDIQNLAPAQDALLESLKSEHRFFLFALDAAAGKTVAKTLNITISSPFVRFFPRAYTLQHGKTLEQYNLWVENIIKRSNNCPEAKDAEPAQLPGFVTANALAANAVGNALLTSWVPTFGLATRACKIFQAHNATQISIAIHAAVSATKGVVPTNLENLNRYFSKIPTDPFAINNQGFQWDVNGKLLRSADGTGFSIEF